MLIFDTVNRFIFSPVKSSIDWCKDRFTHKQFMFLASVLVGLSAGMAAVVLKSFLHTIFVFISENNVLRTYVFYAILPTTGILITILLLKYVVRKKMFKGLSGLLEVIHKKSAIVPRLQMYSQIITSSITVGFGGSAGVEAPIVITGAAYGSNFARTYRLGQKDRTLLLACGVAAGIGGAFNAPIAGVLFALEVLTLDVAITAFIPLIMASASGALISKILLGDDILLSFSIQKTIDYSTVFFYILLGVFAGIVSVYHVRVFHFVEKKMNSLKVNVINKALIGGLLLACLIFLFPSLYGEGYQGIKWISSGNEINILKNSILRPYFNHEWMLLIFILLLILLKPFATGLTLGSGGNGGNFAPSLFMGAYLGFFISRICNLTFSTELPESNFTLVGMAGILSGIYHAPLTAIFLIAEITGGYGLMIPLMIVASVSFAISKFFEPYSMDNKKFAENGDAVSKNKDELVLSSLQVSELVDTEYQAVHPNQSLGDFIDVVKLSTKNIFPVINGQNQFMGVILLDNIKEVMFNERLYSKIRVHELMTIPKEFATNGQSLEAILMFMDTHDYWFLPVVNNNEFSGFISKNKILSNYRMKLKNTIIE